MPGPLNGVKVVDLTTVFAGPYASLMLADLGAEVIKVEAPTGDIVRHIGPSPTPSMGPMFLGLTRNKRGVCLDLRQPAAREALARLVDTADVLIHNIRPQAAARAGVDAVSTRARNARLVHCAIAGFGSEGPYRDLPAYDDVVQAASGMAALQSVGESLQYSRTAMADKTAGLLAFGAICAALLQRARTGEGCAVEVPMLESLVSYLLVEHLYGRTYDPPTSPAGYPRQLAPDRRPYRTADGMIGVMIVDDRHWRAFFEVAGLDHLTDDPKYADIGARTDNTDELYAHVAEVMITRTTAEWVELLRAREVPCMPAATLDDVLADPHLEAVGLFEPAEHPDQGRYTRVRNPLRFSTGIDDNRSPAPLLGEHTAEVLRELGYTGTEIDELTASGAAVADEAGT